MYRKILEYLKEFTMDFHCGVYGRWMIVRWCPSRGVLAYAAQTILKIDDDIGKKFRFWTESK